MTLRYCLREGLVHVGFDEETPNQVFTEIKSVWVHGPLVPGNRLNLWLRTDLPRRGPGVVTPSTLVPSGVRVVVDQSLSRYNRDWVIWTQTRLTMSLLHVLRDSDTLAPSLNLTRRTLPVHRWSVFRESSPQGSGPGGRRVTYTGDLGGG